MNVFCPYNVCVREAGDEGGNLAHCHEILSLSHILRLETFVDNCLL